MGATNFDGSLRTELKETAIRNGENKPIDSRFPGCVEQNSRSEKLSIESLSERLAIGAIDFDGSLRTELKETAIRNGGKNNRFEIRRMLLILTARCDAVKFSPYIPK
jgi:hypothetical protein